MAKTPARFASQFLRVSVSVRKVLRVVLESCVVLCGVSWVTGDERALQCRLTANALFEFAVKYFMEKFGLYPPVFPCRTLRFYLPFGFVRTKLPPYWHWRVPVRLNV
jgi:hypothetical protein